MHDPASLVTPHRSHVTRAEYIERICRGGMPLAVARDEPGRARWFDNYMRVALSRDVTELSKIRQSALLPTLLRVTPQRLARLNPTALSEFGHLIETFVVSELHKQSSWRDEISTIGHWRTHDNQEVDLVIARTDGSVTAFEVKANARVQNRDARGLRSLRKARADTFNAGFVLHTDESTFHLEDRIIVAPIDILWTPPT